MDFQFARTGLPEFLVERYIGIIGLAAMVGIAWGISSNRRAFPWRMVITGLLLQVSLAALLILPSRFQSGNGTVDVEGNRLLNFFSLANLAVEKLQEFVDEGSRFVFRMHGVPEGAETGRDSLLTSFAFGVLPTVITFACLMAILYHLGVMQWVVRIVAFVVQKTLGTSGPETLAAAANVFVGHTEAPLVVRPYINKMTDSELFAMMTGGFATVTGSLVVLYASYGAEPGHLIIASLISAPASLLIAKVIMPEANPEQTQKSLNLQLPKTADNLIGAAADGASEGVKLALNIAAMLIAFLAVIALLDFLLGQVGILIDWLLSFFSIETRFVDANGSPTLSLSSILGTLFYPIAYVIGIPSDECFGAGQILGMKMAANEIVAYGEMKSLIDSGALSERSRTILTYALAGFANFGAIGIQIGGIGGLEPQRRQDVARLGLRAMVGGTLACNMTACVASLMIP